MQSTDRAQFATVLVGMAAMKPGAKLTPEAIELWWSSMRARWSIEDFTAAAEHLVRTLEWMPSPFHFEQLRNAGNATAAEAWLLVLSGAPLPADSRAMRAAKIVGGQYTIRHADIETALPHIQRRFMEAYDELGDVEQTREAVPQLVTHDAARKLLVDLSAPKLLR